MRIAALDLTRFFAALSVVLYHYISRKGSDAFPFLEPITDYGYLGVPLFFVISGYVIALSAHNRTAFEFAISRFTRLYPALWAGVIFTVVVCYFFKGQTFPLLHILANFTLLNDYLGIPDVDGVYWTLHAELKFYACVFFLLAFGVFDRYKVWLSVWLALTILYLLIRQPFFMGWFIHPGYSSFFIGGVALYLIQARGTTLFNHAVLIISLVISCIYAYQQAPSFLSDPSHGDKLVSVLLVAGIYLLLYLISQDKLALQTRPVYTTLGALTYPLYLIHSIAGKAIIDTLSRTLPEQAAILLVLLFMLLTSWLINLLIERPLASPLKEFLISRYRSIRTATRYSGGT